MDEGVRVKREGLEEIRREMRAVGAGYGAGTADDAGSDDDDDDEDDDFDIAINEIMGTAVLASPSAVKIGVDGAKVGVGGGGGGGGGRREEAKERMRERMRRR